MKENREYKNDVFCMLMEDPMNALTLYNAIERAIDRCIEEKVFRDFLIEHRSEVVKVTRLDYTFEQQILLEREDARKEGREEGREEGVRKETNKGRIS